MCRFHGIETAALDEMYYIPGIYYISIYRMNSRKVRFYQRTYLSSITHYQVILRLLEYENIMTIV